MCQVLVDENKTKLYLAYIGNVNESRVHEIVSKKLPDYMLPQYIKKFTKFPLLSSGKTDFESLISSLEKDIITFSEMKDEEDSEIKNTIKKLLIDIVGIDNNFNIKCNFFELGGTSLLAIQFIRSINDSLNIGMKITTLFESNSIEDFIEKVEEYIDGEGI